MKKRSLGKLTLSKETVRNLEDDLGNVNGGNDTGDPTCTQNGSKNGSCTITCAASCWQTFCGPSCYQ